jgi:SPP1 family phage portal protein
LEQYRLAYMKLTGGISMDAAEHRKMIQTGAVEVPPGGDVGWIVKDLPVDAVEKFLDRTHAAIMRFSKSVNFNDEAFSGNASGVAIRYKLIALESKCMGTQREFHRALDAQFRLLVDLWSKRGLVPAGMDVDYTFTRNLPVNYADEAGIVRQLKGIVSEETLLSILSFISDPQAELDRIAEESSSLYRSLYDPPANVLPMTPAEEAGHAEDAGQAAAGG